MTARVVIVADDLTGAMDAAGPLAARGLVTLAVATVEGCTPQHLAGAEVVSINADSRHLSADEAAHRVRRVVAELCDPDAEILIKKIDSTLRGNVVAETLAMLSAGGRTAAVVAPAFPAQGRTVVQGVVHVNGIPLKDTNFARDALTPPPLEPLDCLFSQADVQATVSCIGSGEPIVLAPGQGRQIFAVDATSEADLRTSVKALHVHLRSTLLVGSSGITEAMAQVYFSDRESGAAAPTASGPLLFVVGSRAEQSAQQVAALVDAGGAELFAAPNGRVDVDAAVASRASSLILKAVAGENGRAGDAESVARGLAEGTAAVLQRRPLSAVIATGGDTAIAILQRLSQPALRVIGNLLPGIPFSSIRGAHGDVWFVTKAGGFGARETFVGIANRLRGAASEPPRP